MCADIYIYYIISRLHIHFYEQKFFVDGGRRGRFSFLSPVINVTALSAVCVFARARCKKRPARLGDNYIYQYIPGIYIYTYIHLH